MKIFLYIYIYIYIHTGVFITWWACLGGIRFSLVRDHVIKILCNTGCPARGASTGVNDHVKLIPNIFPIYSYNEFNQISTSTYFKINLFCTIGLPKKDLGAFLPPKFMKFRAASF